MVRKLNLGCGAKWKELYPDYEGLDIIDYGQEWKGDVRIILLAFTDGLFDEVMANHFLEHFSQNELKDIFLRVYDILKKGGIFRIVVPHKDRPEAWYLVHKTFFNEETFKMFDRTETDSYTEFGKWKVKSLVTNNRGNIHCTLEKL